MDGMSLGARGFHVAFSGLKRRCGVLRPLNFKAISRPEAGPIRREDPGKGSGSKMFPTPEPRRGSNPDASGGRTTARCFHVASGPSSREIDSNHASVSSPPVGQFRISPRDVFLVSDDRGRDLCGVLPHASGRCSLVDLLDLRAPTGRSCLASVAGWGAMVRPRRPSTPSLPRMWRQHDQSRERGLPGLRGLIRRPWRPDGRAR